MTPIIGKPAPAFTLDTDAGTSLSLGELKGKPVVLFFYPKDDTSGCTIEACEFRDLFPRFKHANAVILGVSPDSVESHVKFKTKFKLPYTLLADTGHKLAESYEVWKQKSMFGRKYMGVVRTTFIIDAKGTLRKIFEKVNPEGHAEEVEQALKEL